MPLAMPLTPNPFGRQKLLCCRGNATNVSIQNRIGADQMPPTFCKKTKSKERSVLCVLDPSRLSGIRPQPWGKAT